MIPRSWKRILYGFFGRLLQADMAKLPVLTEMVLLDYDRKAIAKAERSGQGSFKDLLILVPIILAVLSLLLGGVAFFLHERPHMVVFICTHVVLLMVLTYAVSYILGLLAADEGFRVIASWPVDSTTYLASRMVGPLSTTLLATLLLMAPATLVMMVMGPFKLIQGLLLLVTCILLGLALVLFVISAYIMLLKRAEPEQVTLIGMVGFVAYSLVVPKLIELYSPMGSMDFSAIGAEHLPIWYPITWMASLVCFDQLPIWMMVLASISLLVLPLSLYLVMARGYTRMLSQSRVHGMAARGGFFVKLLSLNSKRKADQVLAWLCVAHGRADWRFRSQLMMVPLLMGGLMIAPFLEFDVLRLFQDPMDHSTLANPSMVWIILIALPPVIAVPLLSSSKDHCAIWHLRLSPISVAEFAAATRYIMRVVFVLPLLLLVACGYVIAGAPLLSVVGHLVMMAVIAEVMVCGMQVMFADFPFALEYDDETLVFKMVPIFLLYEMVSGLVAATVLHVFYRWWWAYFLGIGLMFVMRHMLIKGQVLVNRSPHDPEAEALREKEPIMDGPTAALMTAIEGGRVHTVKLLMARADLEATDAQGRTALDLAKAMGNRDVLELVEAGYHQRQVPT